MSRQKKFSWMINPRGFIKLVGGEYELMQQAGGSVIFKFYLASVLILLIALLSFVSIFYAVELLFDVVVIEIILSAFLSLLFLLLFVFIVNTFTKDAKQQRLFSLSNITRLGFVMFIGFIISQPIGALCCSDRIEKDIADHKSELVKSHLEKISHLFEADISKLLAEKRKYTELGMAGYLPQIEQELLVIAQKEKKLAAASAFYIERGAYFIYRIKIVAAKYPASWIISLSVIVLFLLPVFIVYSISADEEYFKRKKEQEKDMIDRAYKAFAQKYSDLFLKTYQLKLEFYSKFEDPPFNTKIRKPPVCQSANDFHERYANT